VEPAPVLARKVHVGEDVLGCIQEQVGVRGAGIATPPVSSDVE
jgi:hypothetical protein